MERMSRVSLFALVASLLLPVVAGAQVMAPPMPPAPTTPPPPPAPARPPAPPQAPMALYVPPVFIDTDAIQSAVEAGRAVAENSQAIREAAQQAAEQAREAVAAARASVWDGIPGRAGLPALAPMAYAWDMQDFSQPFRVGSSDSNYSSGLSLLMQHQYENAITRFDRVISAKSSHSDGALYYKAWALSKLGRSDEAVA